jgi:hypothetical protein
MSDVHGLTPEVHTYLVELRDSGTINMMGAAPYLQKAFGLTRPESRRILKLWLFGTKGQ